MRSIDLSFFNNLKQTDLDQFLMMQFMLSNYRDRPKSEIHKVKLIDSHLP